MKKASLHSIIFLLILSVFSANNFAKGFDFTEKKEQKVVSQNTTKQTCTYKKMSIEATIHVFSNQILVYFQALNKISFLHYIYCVPKTKKIFFRNIILEILFKRLAPANAP